MASAKENRRKINDDILSWLRDVFRAGPVTFFILVNGIVITGIAFIILHFSTTGIRAEDTRNMVRDILTGTEQAVREIEKTVSSLGYFYSTEVQHGTGGAQTPQRMQKMLLSGAQFSAIIWATDKDVWLFEDIARNRRIEKFRGEYGLPDYQALAQATAGVEYNQVRYLHRTPWPALSRTAPDPSEMPAGLVIKMPIPGGGTGILLAVSTPDRVFGNSWMPRRNDIDRVSIQDRDSGKMLVDRRFDLMREGSVFFMPETVDSVLQLGDRYWNMRVTVPLSTTGRMLDLLPWGVAFVILSLTFMAAALAEKKYRQDQKFAAMSRDLEGAHHELQSKTSERDRLFHALRKSEREYRAVINSVSDVIFETDENGKLLFLNETWKKITQREISDTVGVSLFSLLDPGDQAKQKEMFEELVRGERQSYRSETRLNVGHGVYKPIEIAFSMLRMAEDKTIRIVGTITDIEKRRRAELAVREAEMRFRTIVENSISGIYQTSPDGRFISANKALAEILGYDTTEELVFAISDIGTQVYVNPDDRKDFVQRLLFEGRISGLETQVYRKDGKKIWVMENARVVRSERGGVAYYEGSIWDVTERREAEEAMKQARIQAEISSRSRMEFLANMSHELRTPLNAVIGFSEIIKDEVMGEINIPVYREYAKDIFDSGNHLLKIISEILEVSKIETGNRELNLSNFKLARAVNACRTIMMSRIEQSGVGFTVNLPEDLPELLAEELGFKQILLNLIGNAIKFTPAGGQVEVTARVVPDTGEMQIDITDTGIGMSAEEIRKALTPFGKVDNNFATMKEGTGLGLTIVESLVRLHGGDFTFISEKGKGTTARVIMPAFRVLGGDQAPNVIKMKA